MDFVLSFLKGMVIGTGICGLPIILLLRNSANNYTGRTGIRWLIGCAALLLLLVLLH